MDLRLSFPDDAGVIADEAARVHALSPEERMRSFGGIPRAGARTAGRAAVAGAEDERSVWLDGALGRLAPSQKR